jgi:hypothetical protein
MKNSDYGKGQDFKDEIDEIYEVYEKPAQIKRQLVNTLNVLCLRSSIG